MPFEITGHKAAVEGSFIRTQAHTAADALRFAREWAEQGVSGITIVNTKGESYDIDRFGMIVSAKEAPDGPPDLKVSAVQPTRQRLSCSSD